jgi:hypothetical protein
MTVAGPSCTTLNIVLSGVRVSSGVSMLLDSTLAMACSLLLLLGARRVLADRTVSKPPTGRTGQVAGRHPQGVETRSSCTEHAGMPPDRDDPTDEPVLADNDPSPVGSASEDQDLNGLHEQDCLAGGWSGCCGGFSSFSDQAGLTLARVVARR